MCEIGPRGAGAPLPASCSLAVTEEGGTKSSVFFRGGYFCSLITRDSDNKYSWLKHKGLGDNCIRTILGLAGDASACSSQVVKGVGWKVGAWCCFYRPALLLSSGAR